MVEPETVQPSTSEQAEEQNAVKDVLGAASLEAFLKPAYAAIREAVVAANSLPEGDERPKYKKNNDFKRIMKEEGERILGVMQMVVTHIGKGRNVVTCSEEDLCELIVDCNDILLDRSSLNMDVMEGIREPEVVVPKHHKAVSGSWNRMKMVANTTTTAESPTLRMTKVTSRPQLQFKDKIDNTNTPWVPRLKEKPNSMKPLAILVETTDEGDECYSHPYEFELERWTPLPEQLTMKHPVKPKELGDTELMYVDNVKDLDVMMKELKGHNEIAVDLEHHSYRSFMGFTCLMQISTKDKDYIVDTLALRDDLFVLNEVFTKPTVLKVFHGAENDIEWLQRDLCVYVVNMFDTHQAAKMLDFPRVNLAHLLNRFCGIDANKHFQLFDWRTRPLPVDALKYAREDTHYLLYIYSMMNNELIKKAKGNTNLLESVYQRSTEVCKRKYTKPILEEDSHMLLYRRGKRLFDNRQLYALKELYRWRDRMARSLDESIGYILPNHMMMQIAENLPREMQGILACCNPIPPVVRQSLQEIHYILLAARQQPLVKTIRESGTAAPERTNKFSLMHKWDGCGEPLRDDLPTLLGSGLPEPPEPPASVPAIPIFEEDDVKNSKEIMKKIVDIENKKFLSPYQRYLMVLPYVNQIEQEQREKEEKDYEEQRKRQKQEEAEKNDLILKQEVIMLNEPPVIPLSQQKAQKRKVAENESPEPVQFKEPKQEPKKKGKNRGKARAAPRAPPPEEPDTSDRSTIKLEEGKYGKTKVRALLKNEMTEEGSSGSEAQGSPPAEAQGSSRVKPERSFEAMLKEDVASGGSGTNDWRRSRQEREQNGRAEEQDRRRWPREGGRRWPEGREQTQISLLMNTTASKDDAHFKKPYQVKDNRERPFVPYNYKNVDFNRFHSGESFVKLNENQFNKQKGKRKQQFGGKNFSFKNKRGKR